MSSKRKLQGSKKVQNEYEEEDLGRPKKIPRTLEEKDSQKRLIIVLENASLETIKVNYSILVPNSMPGHNRHCMQCGLVIQIVPCCHAADLLMQGVVTPNYKRRT